MIYCSDTEALEVFELYSNDSVSMIHYKEMYFRELINNDTLLFQKYLQSKEVISKIVKQKIIEGLLQHSLVTTTNFPEFYEDANNIAKELGLSKPKYIFVKETCELGASTIAADTNDYVIFFHSAIFNNMSRDERKVLLAHELTHVKLLHSRYAVTLKMLDNIALDSLIVQMKMTTLQLFRYFEFSADRGAYLTSKVNKTLFLATIMRFASGVSNNIAKQSVESYIEQIELFEDLKISDEDLEKYYSKMPEKKQDNPFPIIKAREIISFINSQKE